MEGLNIEYGKEYDWKDGYKYVVLKPSPDSQELSLYYKGKFIGAGATHGILDIDDMAGKILLRFMEKLQ